MLLHLLGTTPCPTIYDDSGNDWLFLDWRGEVPLAQVQATCVQVGPCLPHRPYLHVLNSNAQVTNASWSIAA